MRHMEDRRNLAWLQLIANGKLETRTTIVFGFTRRTCLTSCSWYKSMLSRSRPSRPSLGDVHGNVSPAFTHSRPISGPHVGSFPTTTIATSDLRAAARAAAQFVFGVIHR